MADVPDREAHHPFEGIIGVEVGRDRHEVNPRPANSDVCRAHLNEITTEYDTHRDRDH